MKNFGTPKDLPELVAQLATLEKRELERMGGMMIRDYLAQKFGVAMLENAECGNTLKTLFLKMTKNFEKDVSRGSR